VGREEVPEAGAVRELESSVVGIGEAESGSHGTDGRGGEDALRHPKGHATPYDTPYGIGEAEGS
jgi:hypothetical protein